MIKDVKLSEYYLEIITDSCTTPVFLTGTISGSYKIEYWDSEKVVVVGSQLRCTFDESGSVKNTEYI